MTDSMLRLDGVSKSFGGVRATNNVSLEIPQGELHAVIGPNGAGKSTLFALIAGQLKPDSGRLYLEGSDMTGIVGHRRVRLGIARAFQVARVFGDMDVRQNVEVAVLAHRGRSRAFWGRGHARAVRGQVATILQDARLGHLASTLASDLSQGDRKRLEIAMALALEPRLLLLDEPTAGMSPEETESTVELVRRLWREQGMTVLLTEHDMSVVFGLAQQLTVLHQGAVLCTGLPDEMRSRPDVQDIYLGHGTHDDGGDDRGE
jgi:branched-chain amino acid transport system ATP-binding protein